MSERKWTPGPWGLSKESPRIVQKDYSSIGSDVGFLIASTMGRDDSGFYASESEADANARLIAAAPDLVEALEGLARMHRERFGLDGAYDTEIRVAESALAKAYGETNHD